ncbi:MAG: hypothetical protein ACLQFI_14890 [Methylocella sp.]
MPAFPDLYGPSGRAERIAVPEGAAAGTRYGEAQMAHLDGERNWLLSLHLR